MKVALPYPDPACPRAMADCRSLVEFLRAFKHHRRATDSSACSRSRRASSPDGGRGGSFYDNSPLAAVDAAVLLAVLGVLGFLVTSYMKLLFLEVGELLHPAALCFSAATFVGDGGRRGS